MSAVRRLDHPNTLRVLLGTRIGSGILAFVLVGCAQSPPPVAAPPMDARPAGDEKALQGLDAYNPVYKLNTEGRVTDLILQGKHILPAVMVEVGKLTALERLNLVSASLTDDSLTHLRGLSHLKVLRLGSTPIGDKGLVHLENLQELRHVYVPNTMVTSVGVKRLRTALPIATIHE